MIREDKGGGGEGTRSRKSEKRRFDQCIQRQDQFDAVLVFPLVSSA